MVYVYVVVDLEMGWDNIIGCFTSEDAAEECKSDRGESALVLVSELEDTYNSED